MVFIHEKRGSIPLRTANMTFFVYMIGTKVKNKTISYVGYTNNLKNRLNLHNTSKRCKIYQRKKMEINLLQKYKNKNEAMKNEYKLKKLYIKK